MALLCLYVNHEIAPRSHLARRDMRTLAGAGAGLKLLEPGHFIDFPGMKIWFSRRDGDVLQDLLIFDRSQGGRNREVRAESARVVVQGNDLHLDMQRVRIEPISDTEPGVATATRLTHILPDAMKPRAYKPTIKDYRFAELSAHIASLEALVRESRAELREASGNSRRSAEAQLLILRDRMQQLSSTRTEWHRRITLAVAACAFVLLGMPLGIRAQRRESTIGVAIGLVVTLLYYLLVISADALAKRPEFHPQLLAWVPPCLCVALSCWLAARHQ
jgi:lipopolysaccharide export system permease protein